MSARQQREKPCTWTEDRGWVTPEHERDCKDPTCPGCRPCPKSHCDLRGRRCPNHVQQGVGEYTCPACIGRTRKDLAAIVELYAVVPLHIENRHGALGPLLEEAADAGLESEAFNLIGPAAAPEQWSERRRRLVAVYERRGWCDWPRHDGMAEDDPHHPYAVLSRWDQAMRESYGPHSDLFVTISTAASYLTGLLKREDCDFPHTLEFEEFVTEIAACRNHLEQTLHDSRTPEEGRHCPRCVETAGEGPRLRKRYAEHPKLQDGRQCVQPPRSREHPDGCGICAGDEDTWHCPSVPEHWWPEHDYRDRVAADYVEHAEKLTMADLPARTGIKASTLRRWAGRTYLGTDDQGEAVYGPPRLRARGRNSDGRKLYRVAEAEELARTVSAVQRATRFGALA
jgi:hypothetical protein